MTPSSQTDAKSSLRAQGRQRAPKEQRWSLQSAVRAPPVVGWLSSSWRSPAADFWDANTSARRGGGCCAPPGLPQQGEGWLCQDHCCKCPPVRLSQPAWHRGHHRSIPVPAGSSGPPVLGDHAPAEQLPAPARLLQDGAEQRVPSVPHLPAHPSRGGLAVGGKEGGVQENQKRWPRRGSVSSRGACWRAKTWPRGT